MAHFTDEEMEDQRREALPRFIASQQGVELELGSLALISVTPSDNCRLAPAARFVRKRATQGKLSRLHTRSRRSGNPQIKLDPSPFQKSPG